MDAQLFGRWSYRKLDGNKIEFPDESLQDHIALESNEAQVFVPHTAGRWQKKRFHKDKCPLSERLVCALMFHGRNNGKKQMAIRHVQQAFELINLQTDENPLQVLVNAIYNVGPREDSCRVGNAGVVRLQAVDVSPMRRVNRALFTMCEGVRKSSFRNVKTFPECLADEIVGAATKSPNSYAIKKKQEIERTAVSNR